MESNSLLKKTLPVNVPDFQIYNHSMQHILADDRKPHLSLNKIAQSAKSDALGFQSLTEQLLSGDLIVEAAANPKLIFCCVVPLL